MDEMKVLAEHLHENWYYWFRKGRKHALLAKFYEKFNIVAFDGRVKKWTIYNISDIYQLREFVKIEDEKELKKIEKQITMLKLKMGPSRGSMTRRIIDKYL